MVDVVPLVLLAAVLGAGTACRGPAVVSRESARVAKAQITADGLLETVENLSSSEHRGRLAGSEGHRTAAEAAARRLADLGLEPGGDDGYLQHFQVECNEIVGEPVLQLLDDQQGTRSFELGPDFLMRGFTGSGEVEAEVVFCGYGLSLPDRGYDDYAGVDVQGKVVLVLKNGPGWQLDDEGWGEHHLPRPRARTAAAHGAAGLLMVWPPGERGSGSPIGSVMHGPGEHPVDLPAAHVSREVAAELLAGVGLELGDLQADIDRHRRPRSVPTGTRVRLEVEARHRGQCDTVNVVAVAPGRESGPGAAHVVVGAHLDHVGAQGGVVFPGANDNASGSAALMAMAAALAAMPEPLERSVVLVLFSAEEQGLLGAEAYVADPALPLDRAVAMVNLDCIGSGRQVRMGGGESSPELWRLAREIDRAGRGLMVEDTWWGGGADAQPFFEAGVPTLYVTTTSGYDHLHLPGDTPETLDPDLLEGASQLAFLTTVAVAQGHYEKERRSPQKSVAE